MNYLYNGVGPWPDIYTVYTTELQKELPFAILFDSTNNGTKYGSTSVWFFKTYEYPYPDHGTRPSVGIIASEGCKFCNLIENHWGEVTDYAGQYPVLYFEYLVWSNFDILNEDGTLYLAASEPVPVTQRNPSAMLMGFQLGPVIRRMRGQKQLAGYLYNSVQMQDVNTVWTDELKKSYPYASITTDFFTIDGLRYLILSEKPLRHTYWVGISGTPEDEVSFEPCNTIHILLKDGMYWQDRADWVYKENESLNLGANAWLWTSYDVLKEDGTVFFAAFEPVYARNGMLAYTGVKLPPLPEWDKEKYPYAIIDDWTGFAYEDSPEACYALVCHSNPPYYNDEKGKVDAVGPCSTLCYRIDFDEVLAEKYGHPFGEWYFDFEDEGGMNNIFESPIWTNTDVLNEDGSVYLAASEPIPVYE